MFHLRNRPFFNISGTNPHFITLFSFCAIKMQKKNNNNFNCVISNIHIGQIAKEFWPTVKCWLFIPHIRTYSERLFLWLLLTFRQDEGVITKYRHAITVQYHLLTKFHNFNYYFCACSAKSSNMTPYGVFHTCG